MGGTIRVRAEIVVEMLRHARSETKTECCGLLAGRGGVITTIFPTENALQSATRYEIAPGELFRLFRHLREEKLEHLGHYHSHLRSDNYPSPTDLDQAFYPDQAYFIVTPREDAPSPVRAFLIRDGAVEELEIESV